MDDSDDRDVLAMTRSDRVWGMVLLGGGGAVLMALLPWLLGLLDGSPFIPFRDVADWLTSFDQWWASLVRVGIGVLVGVGLVVATILDEWVLEVGDDDLVVRHGSDRRVLRRDQVVGIHRDGRTVTIDGAHGRVLFDEKLEAPKDAVRAAFVSRDWPWESA